MAIGIGPADPGLPRDGQSGRRSSGLFAHAVTRVSPSGISIAGLAVIGLLT
jgi:hypothetical protein